MSCAQDNGVLFADAKIIRDAGTVTVLVAVAIALVGDGAIVLIAVGTGAVAVAVFAGATGDGDGSKIGVAVDTFATVFVAGGCSAGVAHATSATSAMIAMVK